jgi:beta-lactamase superfamily II metal-dependent hydrolase
VAEPLEIHVFGGAVGESIILGLPGNRWAIIDVYVSDAANPAGTPSIRFLRDKQVTELEFLCLTHPHGDHVKGVSYLVKNFRIQRFLGFGALPPQQLYNQIVKVLKVKAQRLHDSAQEQEIASELLEALELVNAKVNRREMVHNPVTVNASILDELVAPDGVRLRMVAIAPSGRSVTTYNQQLSGCFDTRTPGRILTEQIDGVHHNEISAAFILEYGAQRVVLGGDLEYGGWQDIMTRPAPGFNLNADLVKVSHHGSQNGYCAGLWEHTLSPRSEAVAVVTAFSLKGLPRPEGLAHLQRNTKQLTTTSLSSLKPRRSATAHRSPFARFPLNARLALDAVFRNVAATSSAASAAFGCCSFKLDGKTPLSQHLSGDAAMIG